MRQAFNRVDYGNRVLWSSSGRGTFSPELLADLKGRGVGARHHAGMGRDTFVAKKPEEDEYGFLDAMFLANLVAGMQGGPPPTPYGTAVGGGNKTWASLPSLMRMSKWQVH